MPESAKTARIQLAVALGLALAGPAVAGLLEGELDPGFYFDGRITLDPTVGDQTVLSRSRRAWPAGRARRGP